MFYDPGVPCLSGSLPGHLQIQIPTHRREYQYFDIWISICFVLKLYITFNYSYILLLLTVMHLTKFFNTAYFVIRLIRIPCAHVNIFQILAWISLLQDAWEFSDQTFRLVCFNLSYDEEGPYVPPKVFLFFYQKSLPLTKT